MSTRVWASLFVAFTVTAGVSAGLAVTTRVEARLARAGDALVGGEPARALVLATLPADVTSPRSEYLRGTALLALGREAEAVEPLTETARRSPDVELQRRALHNLALSRLRLAAATSRPRKELEARASVMAGREALRLRPDTRGTSWNLALAQRLAGATDPSSGGPSADRGGVRLEPGRAAAQDASGAADQPLPGGGTLSPDEARAILDALRGDESESLTRMLDQLLQGDRARTNRRGPPW